MKIATRKMGLNKNYIVGILDDSSFIPNVTAAQKSKELTEFLQDSNILAKFLSGTSVNEILDKAVKENKNIVLFNV